MKQFRWKGLAIAFAVPAVVTTLVLLSRSGRSQAQEPSKNTIVDVKRLVKPTILILDPAGKPIVNNAAIDSAAAANAELSYDFAWTFGGKQQHGWYLYAPLLSRMLAVDDAPASKGFAIALARWQQTAGLNPTGVLDEETLGTIISKWQAARIKNRDLAQPDQLLTVPATEFYDPERLEELRQVEKITYAAYQRMLAEAIKDPSLHLQHDVNGKLAPAEKYLKIISSFRSREYQEKLRRESPNAGRAGLAVNSPHFTGRALDLYVGGDPVDTKDTNRALQIHTPVYLWLVRNAERFGFRPYFYEPWHWEYVGEVTPAK